MGAPRSRRGLVAASCAVVLLLATACSSDDGDDASATTTTAAAVGEEGTISVLAYNVAGLPGEISGGDPGPNMPLISPLLDDHDLVLTQEDFDWWPEGGLIEQLGLDVVHYHERLRADTTHDFASPVHPGPEAAGIDPADRPELQIGDGIGILSRHPLDGWVVQAWEGCFGGLDTADGGAADCPAMKGFRVATMDLGGAEVDVYSLHAEAGGTEEDQRLQGEDFAQLAAFIAEHSEGRAIILGGDTNLHTDGEHDDSGGDADAEIWEDFLAETGLTDTCHEAGCDDPGAIDKIAYRSSGAIELSTASHERPRERFTDADGEDLSDHVPVAVTLDWRTPA